MLKIDKLIPLMILLTGAAVICRAQSPKSPASKQNVAADNILLNAFKTGDVSALHTIIAPEFFNHSGNLRGLDSLKTSISQFHSRMKPVSMELIRQMADNEYVADWVRYNFADPKMVIEGIEMTRYRHGKAVEHWFFPYNHPEHH